MLKFIVKINRPVTNTAKIQQKMVNLHFCMFFLCHFRPDVLSHMIHTQNKEYDRPVMCEKLTRKIVDVNWAQLTEHSSAFLSGIIFQTLIWPSAPFFSLSLSLGIPFIHPRKKKKTSVSPTWCCGLLAFDQETQPSPQRSTFCCNDRKWDTSPPSFLPSTICSV